MGKAFVIDVAKCSGCYNCQLACKDEYVGNDWLPYSKAQPEINQFWFHLLQETCGTTPKVKVKYTPTLCNHCRNAACMNACASDAIVRREDGLILIDPEKCTGCKECMAACPYEAIFFNEELNIAQKCTGCAHLLDNGHALPRCVESCPNEVFKFGDEEDLADDILGAELLKAEEGLKPRVYYRNIPGQFIAGTLFSPEEDEVIIGARVRANSGGKFLETFTDEFGDFWFKDLAIGTWDVYVEADGYEFKAFKGLRTTECINLGDIPLSKK